MDAAMNYNGYTQNSLNQNQPASKSPDPNCDVRRPLLEQIHVDLCQVHSRNEELLRHMSDRLDDLLGPRPTPTPDNAQKATNRISQLISSVAGLLSEQSDRLEELHKRLCTL